ncbi:MAG: bifunctional [glutamate--ammonia ligase]-adenylyl-L-tyrosine phosphorylase/[glutamate--ammonia-ligase] adenylyltransferase [Burkholderiales bacterium]|nr:bifunctional [glutamate--ammonia ligase]-adenylyl-L-tyrosine phosphorylase/[glutamate--ammonia-ligase] adenylyltransferase [Burkholderiales bacterium]
MRTPLAPRKDNVWRPASETVKLHLETNTSSIASGLPAASAYSAWARAQLAADPDGAALAAGLTAAPVDGDAIAALIATQRAAAVGDLGRALRRARRLAMLAIMERDLAGKAGLAEVTGAVSALAEQSLACALEEVVSELTPRLGRPFGEASGTPQALHIVGMGKLGGGELNVSSDIDLIFLYPEEGTTRGGAVQVTAQEYFSQVGKRLIALISATDADGYVFRVDMRLRPWGDGPLAMSFDAFEDYLVAQGRDWERYAWIKGRALTGDRVGDLMALVTPFVYRRYLDFGAIESLKSLHAQIKREVARRELADHVKLGPGGIREVEFIAQALQLIRGGREPGLRLRPTLPALRALAELGLIADAALDELGAAYDFLRRVEHRLQYAEDQQTHMLPRDPAARERLAHAMGAVDWTSFASALDAHRDRVRRHFETVLGDAGDAPRATAGDDAPVEAQLARGGFAAPADLARLIEATRGGARIRRLADSARARFEALLPRLIDHARAAAHPDAALKRLLAFTEAIASRSSYLALLAQSSPALQRLTRLCGSAEWAAGYLTQHPILLDELIDERTLFAAPDLAGYSRQAAAALAACAGDLEAQMNSLREAHHTALFRLLAQDIEGMWTVERLADQLSELADRTLELALAESWRTARGRHREAPEFAIIAYGKLGGKELGYASDLDLIFIHDDTDEHAGEIYARLAQRLVTFLDTQTTAGRLFEVDTRLRPDGASGLLVTSLEAFRDYQRRRAWPWEHQALTRARACAGSRRIGAAFEDERRHILTLERDAAQLRTEVRSMRARMHDGHPNRSGLFDLKHDPGGMVDIEFCVQTLVLAHARQYPQLVGNLGNIALLGMAGEAGLIPAALARAAADAYRDYRRRQHELRLNNVEFARADPAEFAPQIAAVRDLWATVVAD